MILYLSKLPSPVGEILIVTDEKQTLRVLDYADHRARLLRGLRERYGNDTLIDATAPSAVANALRRYFDGDLAALDGIATATPGSGLQLQVWEALRRIPAGQTTSYGELARSLGLEDPRAAIDIGAAVGANPLAIIAPCHRVIASDGSLKGYAGGLHRKRWLLEHEGALAKPEAPVEALRLPGF